MVYTLVAILVFILGLGFIWGNFIALVATILAAIVGYFTGGYGALAVLFLAVLGSGIHKYKSK